MHCLHRDLCRNRRLATTISCFSAQSYTWLYLDKSDKLCPCLHCIFWCIELAQYWLDLCSPWCTRGFFCSRTYPYFDDITVNTLLLFHLTKAILVLSLITKSANTLYRFSNFFNGFNGAFSTLFNRTLPVAAIPFFLSRNVVIEDLWRSYQLWDDNLILHVFANCLLTCQQ